MKNRIYYTLIPIVIVAVMAFVYESPQRVEVNFNNKKATVLTEKETLYHNIKIPFTGKNFIGFREALGFKESQGKYQITNNLGYLGKYQFGKTTLSRFNIYNTHHFLKTPTLQEKAFIAHCSLNKWALRNYIEKNVGKTISGVLITESGILAAAHLGGAGSVKRFFKSNGNYVFKDANGASVRYYLKKFSGYNTSLIKASKKPTI